MRALTCIAFLALAPLTHAQEWSVLGGNSAGNGRAAIPGPRTPDVLWSNTDDPSLISWHPFVSDGRVFVIRESGFPQAGGAAGDALVALDLETGDELWRTTLPYAGDPDTEWIAWIAGARDGRVFASRASVQKPNPVLAFEAAGGAPLWTSTAVVEAFAYDGAAFTADGDLVVGDHLRTVRLDATTGATVWDTPRSCSVSGTCGPAVSGDAVYIDEVAAGGQVLTRLDAGTGVALYSSPVMPGFLEQNSPFVAPDGAVYLARAQNNTAVDFLYCFDDDGNGFTQRWSVPVRWTTAHEFAVAGDGSVYTFSPLEEFVRLDPATGAVTASAGVLTPLGSPNLSPKCAVDETGTVYLSNGWAGVTVTDGRLWAFSPDLAQNYFTLSFSRPNHGGPALGGHGTLVLADLTGVHAWRDPLGTVDVACGASPNSTGQAAALDAVGQAAASEGSLLLRVRDLPLAQFGYFLMSASTGQQPVSNGTLCLGAPQYRFNLDVLDSGASGGVSFVPDFANLPQGQTFAPGSTWWFQLWYRDGVRSNFSSSLGVTWQ